MKYLGHAYGVIPEENNARFEERYGEDGVKREYLVAEGVLWNKFSDAIDIFESSNGVKSQSMELENDYEGYFNEDNVFVFTKARIDGVCILGEGIRPAMVSSTIEAFSASSIKAEMSEMLSEFNAYFSASNQKEGEQEMPTKTEFEQEPEVKDENTELTPENEVTEEAEASEGTDTHEDKTPETEFSKEDEDKEGEEEGNEESDKDDDSQPEVVRQFAVSHEDTRYQIYEKIDNHMSTNGREGYYYVQETHAEHVVISNYEDSTYFKVAYSTEGDEINLGGIEQIFPMFLNQSEKDSIENDRVKREELENELSSLRNYKAGKELEEKEEVLNTFSEELTPEEFKAIKENLSNFSVTDIEKEVGAVLLRNKRFSTTNSPKGQVRATSSDNGDASKYGDLASLFYKK